MVDELALALVHATRDSIDAYLKKKSGADASRQAAEEHFLKVRSSLNELVEQRSDLESQIAQFEAALLAGGKKQSLGTWAAGAVLVAGIVAAIAGQPMGLIGLAVAALLIWIAVAMPAKDAVERASSNLQTSQEQLGTVAAQQVELENSRAAAQAEVNRVQAEALAAKPEKALTAIGHVFYPLAVAKLGDSVVVVDLGGATDATSVSLPDSRDAQGSVSAAASIDAALAAAQRMPVLLQSGSDEAQLDSLHGEEVGLRAAVSHFADVVQSTRVQNAQLPMLQRDEPLAGLVTAQYPHARQVETLRGIAVPVANVAKGALESLKRIDELKGGIVKGGGDLMSGMLATCERLEKTLASYREMRNSALDLLDQSISDVVERADLPHVHMFCPRCNQVPNWVFFRLGIERDSAHRMSAVELLEALQGDPEVAARLVDEGSQWPAQIDAVLSNLGDLELGTQELLGRREAAIASVGARASVVIGIDSQLRAMRDQHARMVQQLDRTLIFLATGQASPRLALSHQARLRLNRASGRWNCPVCRSSFDELEARFGRMLRVKSDLLVPMWNTLWTEKADFRRSEKFRTDEELRQRVIDEQKDMLDPINSYQADMRPVRENILREASAAEEGKTKLTSTVATLKMVGVIDDAQMSNMLAGFSGPAGADLDVARIKREAESRETLLVAEPAAQAARRPTAVDPIDVLYAPSALFHSVPPTVGRSGISVAGQGG